MWHSSLESPLVKPYYYVAVQGLSTLLPSIFKSIRNLGKYHLSEIFVQKVKLTSTGKRRPLRIQAITFTVGVIIGGEAEGLITVL